MVCQVDSWAGTVDAVQEQGGRTRVGWRLLQSYNLAPTWQSHACLGIYLSYHATPCPFQILGLLTNCLRQDNGSQDCPGLPGAYGHPVHDFLHRY